MYMYRNCVAELKVIADAVTELRQNVVGAVAAAALMFNAGTKRTSIVDGLAIIHRNVAGAVAAVFLRSLQRCCTTRFDC